MIDLKFGQQIEMEFGGRAKVLKKIGSGGQGSVYLVEFNGMEYKPLKGFRSWRKPVHRYL